MTPLDVATNLVASPDRSHVVLGVAMLVRGLTDDDGLRQGWPLTPATVLRAASHLAVTLTPAEVADVLTVAPKIGASTLNRSC